jgi:DNA-binding PadR family transcriptional regulator
LTPLRSAMPMHPKVSPLQMLLLIQLEASPKYGYEMLKSIKEAFEGIWEPRTGTIYPALKSLERRELVETQVRDGVGFYHITPSGRQFLLEIGTQQTNNMKFSSRFLETLIKWMSPELKKAILTNMTAMAGEDMNFVGGIIRFLDDTADRKVKLQFLQMLRSNLSTRLVELDQKISSLETDTL